MEQDQTLDDIVNKAATLDMAGLDEATRCIYSLSERQRRKERLKAATLRQELKLNPLVYIDASLVIIALTHVIDGDTPKEALNKASKETGFDPLTIYLSRHRKWSSHAIKRLIDRITEPLANNYMTTAGLYSCKSVGSLLVQIRKKRDREDIHSIKADRDSALAEVARLKAELAIMQCIRQGTPPKQARAFQLLDSGMSKIDVVRELGIGKTQLYKWLKDRGGPWGA